MDRQDWIPVSKRLPEPEKAVLACFQRKNGKQEIIRACYAPKYSVEDVGDYLNESEYNEADDTYYWPEGWYEWNEFDETLWHVEEEVTHWMPLPSAPKKQK